MTYPILGHVACSNFDQAIAHKWLLTSGIGGFACYAGVVVGFTQLLPPGSEWYFL